MLATNILAKLKAKHETTKANDTSLQTLMSKDVVSMLRASYENSGHKRVRVVCLATDFYVTLLLKDVLAKRAGGESGYDPITHEPCFIFNDPQFLDWAVDFHKAVKDVLLYSDQFMVTYLSAAVAGELRHSFGKLGLSNEHKVGLRSFGVQGGTLSRRATQHEFLGTITENTLAEFLKLGEAVFRGYNWGGSYGGPRWGDIARAGLDRVNGTLDAISFVDRVYDLKHNGGPIFDKNQAVDNSYVQDLLDAKLAANSDEHWSPWLKFCSKPVRDCLTKAKKIGVWTGVDPSTKEYVPSLYDANVGYSYDASPDSDYNKKKKLSMQQQPVNEPAQPDYPLVQELAPCPTGKHNV